MLKIKTIVLLLLASFAFSFAACEKPKWDDPAYVNKELQSDDRDSRSMAMSNVSSLPSDKLEVIVPGLINVYQKDSVYKKDAVRHLLTIKSPKAIPVYLEELKTNENNFAAGAASVLGEIGDASVADQLLEAIKNTDKDEIKLAILQAFLKIPSPKYVPELLKVLKLDVDRRPIALLAYACQNLTKIAIQDPSAITDDVIHQVTLAVFFNNNVNQSLASECGLTIESFGDRAVPELIKIYKGDRPDVRELFLKYDTPEHPYPINLSKLIAAQRLNSLRAEPFAPLALADLNTVKEAGKQYSAAYRSNWQMKEAQVTSEELFALGNLGYEPARPVIEGIMNGDKFKKDWEDITDRLVELQLRQDASFSLVRMGNREALPAIMKAIRTGVIDDWEKAAKALAANGQPIKDVERYQMTWILSQSYAELALPDNREEFEKVIEEKRKISKDLADKMSTFLVMFDVVSKCRTSGDDAAQAKCYGDVIMNDKDELKRGKAAWELGRLPAAAALPVLNDVLKVDTLTIREVVELGLFRYGNADTVKVIEGLLESEKNKRVQGLDLDHYRLRMLQLYLQTHKR